MEPALRNRRNNLKDEAATGILRRTTISVQEQYAEVLKYSAEPANSLWLSLDYCALKYATDIGKGATASAYSKYLD